MNSFLKNGMIPWTEGYVEYKEQEIIKSINDNVFLDNIKNKKIDKRFGFRLDDRIVEYPWIFSNIQSSPGKLLDAGSTFNFEYILDHPKLEDKEISIYTFEPENKAFFEKRISYVYGDLRDLPFKNELFDTVVCQSTLEHIDMDNSMYGYNIPHNMDSDIKSYEYLKAISELTRVLKKEGSLLLTFPFGKFENHGFFQQFDEEMLKRILSLLDEMGKSITVFFKYEMDGWDFSTKDELKDTISYNPHTGKGKLDDNAAHSRGICCLQFIKK
ncbi:Methyltransferase domain-containing protein [Flavobacteriaceae bacterium MAR_2010_188]|nr:Methyltransferase domain-containing protein [Flavobacteriaceae bacterium MAR_2010_188]